MIAAPLYAGSNLYYSLLLSAKEVHFDINQPIGKMWALNRCNIIGANGLQTLTIPVVKPEKGSATLLKDIQISEHGNWEHIHWGAIFSAYGKSPFFEYIDRELKHIYENHTQWLVDFNMALNALLTDFVQLPINYTSNSENGFKMPGIYTQNRNKQLEHAPFTLPEYYQPWKERFGFAENLSILDLILNEGNETIRILASQVKK